MADDKQENEDSIENIDNEPTEEAAAISIDDLAGGISGEMPEVTQSVVENSGGQVQTTSTPQNSSDGPVDKYGRSFDASVHKTNSDGSPKLTKKGELWIKAGRGGKSTGEQVQTESVSSVKIGDNVAGSASPDISSEIQKKQECAMAGAAAAHMVFTTGMLIGGDEWAPIVDEKSGKNEAFEMESAWTNYFMSKDIRDFPPGVALSICMVGYAAPRFFQPKTKARAGGFFKKMKLWFMKKKIEREEKKADDEGKKELEKVG